MTNVVKRIVIFTDLDGTLLHSRTYSFLEARPALKLIRTYNIPLVLCSSKTRAEIELYRKRLKIDDPFISENGGGIFIPRNYFPFAIDARKDDRYLSIVLGKSYREIRRRFVRLREKSGIQVKGFGDMTAAAISRLTCLSPRSAGLARRRDYEEPFIFVEKSDRRFLQAIERDGLHWTAGRLFHLMGDHDKGKAVDILTGLYRRQWQAVHTIGLGDSLNDQPMLERVDTPVLIRHVDGRFDRRVKVYKILRTRNTADAGWNEAIFLLFRRLGIT